MKTKLSLIIACIFTIGCLAQSGINYKALIKDAGGNILSSSAINIQFIIYEGAALTTNVYQESHTISTDANGFAIVNIGEGTTGDVFADIAWDADAHYLNVQINTGTGLVDLGTTQFMAVPYALQAEKASNVFSGDYNDLTNPPLIPLPTGLEAIDEGNGIGWRLIGANPDNYGAINEYSTDLSISSGTSTTRGATGINAVAMGYNTTASGDKSTAFGNTSFATGGSSTAFGASTFAPGNTSTAMGASTEALGNISTAMGSITTASGNTSTATGYFTTASGSFSTAIGYGTKAPSHGEIVVGTFNETYTPIDVVAFNENDRLFVIGNGTIITPSNALTVLKNGTITAPSFDIAEITDAKALVTKEYVDANGPTGLEAIDEGNGIGYRIIGRDPTTVGNIGRDGVDFSRSFVGGSDVTWGPTGNNSTTMGIYTTALGNFSMAIGQETLAESENSLAIGRSNIGGGDPLNWVATDPLFEVGIGLGNSRANALTILKNGDIGVVTNSPEAKLHISSGADTGLGNNNGYILLGQANGENISLDNNEIMARNNGVAADLSLQIDGGNLKIGGPLYIGDETIRDAGNNALRINAALLPDLDNVNVLGNPTQRWTTVYATNGTINTSDRREKKNIKELHYGLTEVLQMQPVSFNWKSKNSPDLKIGLIAQDLQELIPEVVKSHIWEKDEATGALTKKELERLGVYYSDLVPVLVKAIQEQQDIIILQKAELASQGSEIEALSEENKNQSAKIEILSEEISEIQQFMKQMNQLEAKHKNLQK